MASSLRRNPFIGIHNGIIVDLYIAIWKIIIHCFNTKSITLKLKRAFIFFTILFLLNSCSSHVSYLDKNGSNDVIVYEDSIYKIQRSTEILGDELMVSHLILNKKGSLKYDITIENISSKIDNLLLKDSFSFSCGYKKSWHKKFVDISKNIKKSDECTSYQIIYYYDAKNTSHKNIVILTSITLLDKGIEKIIQKNDTLARDIKYSKPQP